MTNLVPNPFEPTLKKERVTAELQLHSDQGFQYSLQSDFILTQQYDIRPSIARQANPYDLLSDTHCLKNNLITAMMRN